MIWKENEDACILELDWLAMDAWMGEVRHGREGWREAFFAKEVGN